MGVKAEWTNDDALSVSEYIMRETGYPGATKQEVVDELVRCKDCKYRRYADNRIPSERRYVCDHWGFEEPDPNGFCQWAERRTDG